MDDSLLNTPTQKVIDQETRSLIDRLQLERIPLAGIARAVQVFGDPGLPKLTSNPGIKPFCGPPQIPKVEAAKKKGRLTISM
ncbi:transposase [Limnospira platensis YZ]|nr:transposase [Arthrospira platensis YZ]